MYVRTTENVHMKIFNNNMCLSKEKKGVLYEFICKIKEPKHVWMSVKIYC